MDAMCKTSYSPVLSNGLKGGKDRKLPIFFKNREKDESLSKKSMSVPVVQIHNTRRGCHVPYLVQ